MSSRNATPIPRKAARSYVALKEAAMTHELCLAECEAHGKPGTKVYVVCSLEQIDGVMTYVPLARLFNGNPANEITYPGVDAKRLI